MNHFLNTLIFSTYPYSLSRATVPSMKPILIVTALLFATCHGARTANAATRTWDGRHDTSRIEVTMVYFVPSDCDPLPDWRERVDYYAKRIEQFHQREFGTQSVLGTRVDDRPFVSQSDSATLRAGDANAIYYKTLREVDSRLKFATAPSEAFRILLVLSDINWRPLDDFYRLRPDGDELVFEGNYNNGEHFPGAASGGARAAYLADRGVGWGLVSGDGWRVPYRGSDCVVYHEGCGHTVGLPHPEPGNSSVMSLGQYRGWISESWLDKEQKSRLGWEPPSGDVDVNQSQVELFTKFRALPQPQVPRPGEEVRLRLDWPASVRVKSLSVRIQTSLDSAWMSVPVQDGRPEFVSLGTFDREIPVSYRVDSITESGASVELWGYFQVRREPDQNPQPMDLDPDLDLDVVDHVAVTASNSDLAMGKTVDLLELIDPAKNWTSGPWRKQGRVLESPKQFGAKLEIPYAVPAAYQWTLVVEPLDEPGALQLGQVSGIHRFATLFGFQQGNEYVSAIENVDGHNVGNETTFRGPLFVKNRMSQVIVRVSPNSVNMWVDGQPIVNWKGNSDRLSLSEYWTTPNAKSLFLGAYDCRFRFHRVTIQAISSKVDRAKYIES